MGQFLQTVAGDARTGSELSWLGARVISVLGQALGQREDCEFHENRLTAEVEAEGYLIVTNDPLPGGAEQITEVSTGRVIAAIVDPDEGWCPEWFHRDAIGDQAFALTRRPLIGYGLPDELVRLLQEFADEHPVEAEALIVASRGDR